MTILIGKYLLVLVGMIVEGPVLMITSGFLLRLGVFSLIPLFLVLVIGDIAADIGWYYLGRHLADPILRRYGRFIGATPELLEKGKTLFSRYHTKILIISKLTLGFGLAIGVMMAAGASRVPFRKFLTLNILGELVLVSVLLSVGYFFGRVTDRLAGDSRLIFGAIMIGLTALVLYGFAGYIKRRIAES